MNYRNRLNIKQDLRMILFLFSLGFTQGYFNDTLNAFQLGRVCEKEWAGIEVLKMDGKPMPVSLVATTYVEAYRINMNKLQSEFKVRFCISWFMKFYLLLKM